MLSQIPSNGRLARKGKGRFTLEGDNFYTPLKRWAVTGDSRWSGLADIETTLTAAFEYVRLLIDSKHMKEYQEHVASADESALMSDNARTAYIQLKNIERELGRCIIGLRNLKDTTYSSDADMVNNLEVQLQKVEDHRDDINRRFPNIVEDVDTVIV